MSRGWLRELGFGALLGAAAMIVVFLCLLLTRSANAEWNAATIGKFWISGWIVGFVPWATQELLFRGYPLIILTGAIGKHTALLLTSIAFALYHGSGGPIGWLNLALLGAAMGIMFLRTGRLWAPIGLHYGWNLFQYLVFNIPSYVETMPQSLLRTNLTGGTLLTGGDFGVEASIISTGVVLVLVALALKAPYFAMNTSTSSAFSTPVRPLQMLGNTTVFLFSIAGIILCAVAYMPGIRPLFKEYPGVSSVTLYERQEPPDTVVTVEFIGLSLADDIDKSSLTVTLRNMSDIDQQVTVEMIQSWRDLFKRKMFSKKTAETMRPASEKVVDVPIGLRNARANAIIEVIVRRESKITNEAESLLFRRSFQIRDFIR